MSVVTTFISPAMVEACEPNEDVAAEESDRQKTEKRLGVFQRVREV